MRGCFKVFRRDFDNMIGVTQALQVARKLGSVVRQRVDRKTAGASLLGSNEVASSKEQRRNDERCDSWSQN